jgi:hypothetical protein
MVKRGNVVLFGVSVMNSMLNDVCYKDFVGRPVRGFFGFIVSALDIADRIPICNLEPYKRIYEEYISPFWEKSKDELVRNDIVVDLGPEDLIPIQLDTESVDLNYDDNKTVILGSINILTAFSTALKNNRDISIITGINSRGHAFAQGSTDYKFMNAVVNGIDIREEKIFETPKAVHHPEDVKPPKKALRPKLTILIVVVVLILLSIMMKKCIGGQTGSQSSALGVETTKNPVDTIKTMK